MDPQIQIKKKKHRPLLVALSLALLSLPQGSLAAAPADDGDDSYRFLAGLVDKGHFELAAKEGSKFLRDYPDHAKAELARYRLAGALFELERSEEAAEHYARLSRERGFEYRAEASFRLGQCQLSLERLEEAKASFAQVRQLNQDYLNGPATFFLAETAFRQGDLKAAERDYQLFLAQHGDAEYLAGARRGMVWCAWNQQQAEETIRRAKTFLQSHGSEAGSDELRILLGEAYLEAEQPGLAMQSFNAVSSKEYGDARRRGAGFALAAQDQHGPAAAEFALLLRDFPRSRFAPEARLQLGLQALRSGNAKAAVRALKLATRDRDPEAYFWLAEASEELGDQRAALRALDSALELDPSEALSARIHSARGDLLSAMGRDDEALAAYSRAGSDYALYAAAVTNLNQGDEQRAMGLVKTLLKNHADSTYRLRALAVLGEAYFSLGRHDEAIETFGEVLRGGPEPTQAAEARARIAWSHYQSGRLGAALQGFDVLTREHAEEAASEEGLYMLGRVALEAGERDRALAASRRYLERYPEGVHLPEVLFTAGQADQASAGLSYFERLANDFTKHALAASALLELGDRQSQAGQVEAAIASYRRLLSTQRQSELVPEALYGLGWCLYDLKRYAESAKQLSAASGRNDASDSLRKAALELAVWSFSKAGDAAGATDSWRAFAALAGSEAASFESLRTVLGAWSSAGRPKQAQSLLSDFLRGSQDPAISTRALLESTYLALESGDLKLAERQAELALKQKPQDAQVAEACFFVGEAQFAAGERERAAKLYRAAVAQPNPMHANALYKLGFALMQTEELAGAAAAFGRLVDEHGDSELFGEALFLQGEALFRSEELEQAIACFERLRRQAPEHQVLPKALFRLGLSQGRLERWGAAETSLALLARAAPEFENRAEAELWRGRALAAQRKRRAARQAFERVISLDKGELAARARLGLGQLFEAEGRKDEALSEYLKVALLYAHDEEVAEALFRAGTCLEAQGNREQAIAQYQEIIKQHPRAKFAARAKRRLGELNQAP